MLDFALVCDILQSQVERAKEDSPHSFGTMISQVVYEWWGHSQMSMGEKAQLVQAAFVYMNKKIFFKKYYVNTPTLPTGSGLARMDILASQAHKIPHEQYIITGKISSKVYETIRHTLVP